MEVNACTLTNLTPLLAHLSIHLLKYLIIKSFGRVAGLDNHYKPICQFIFRLPLSYHFIMPSQFPQSTSFDQYTELYIKS